MRRVLDNEFHRAEKDERMRDGGIMGVTVRRSGGAGGGGGGEAERRGKKGKGSREKVLERKNDTVASDGTMNSSMNSEDEFIEVFQSAFDKIASKAGGAGECDPCCGRS